jgi:hypothetical protein
VYSEEIKVANTEKTARSRILAQEAERCAKARRLMSVAVMLVATMMMVKTWIIAQ